MPSKIKIYIPEKDLVVGAKYRCAARNLKIGTWNGTCFDYIHTKFDERFKDVEYHWDNKIGYPGTVKPLKRVDNLVAQQHKE